MAEAPAEKFGVADVAKAMSEIDRAALLKILQMPANFPVVADLEGLHPVSLFAKSVLRIKVWQVPFLNRGACGQCCQGAYLARWGHKTVALKCFSAELPSGSSVCGHCKQLWTLQKESEEYYELKETMDVAWARYKKGERKALRNWDCMSGLADFFSEEIQQIKDTLAGSQHALPATWPDMSVLPAMKTVMQEAGVLFADAGRSRNPYVRTAEEQRVIADYTRTVLRSWLKVRATIADKAKWLQHLRDLQRRAKVIAQAAMWSMQTKFSAYPIFAGAIVAADVMAAGLNFAAGRFAFMAAKVADDPDESVTFDAFSWGPAVDTMTDWAKTVALVKRPQLISKALSASKASAKADSVSSSASSKSGWFYGIARGKNGDCVKRHWHSEVKPMVIGWPGAIYKKFRSEAAAKGFVERMKAKAGPAKWWVLKGSLRDGAYASKLVAQSYKGAGELTPMWSIPAAKEFLGVKWVRVFNDTVAQDDGAPRSAASGDSEVFDDFKEFEGKFFALRGGSSDGVFDSIDAVLLAKAEGGGVYDVFDTKWDAQRFCEGDSNERVYVVFAGSKTGIMTAGQMVAATRGVESVVEGPMSRQQAERIWNGGGASAPAGAGTHEKQSVPASPPRTTRSPSATAAAPTTPTKTSASDTFELQSPSEAAIERAWKAGKKRVFSCWLSHSKARVALSWEDAIAGVEEPEVRVTASEDDLFANIAKAEYALQQQRTPVTPKKTVAQRLAEARKKMSSSEPKSARVKRTVIDLSTDTSASAAASTVASSSHNPGISGQSQVGRVGLSGVVRTKQVVQMTRTFIDAQHPVKIVGPPAEPDTALIFGGLPGPRDVTYLKAETKNDSSDLTLKHFMHFKDTAMKAWSLKKFGEFMEFCELGKQLCKRSSKTVAAVNGAFFVELGAIAVRVYNSLKRRKTLGVDEIRFQVRMFIQLQYATNELVLHTGTQALRVFDDVVDEFAELKSLYPAAASSKASSTQERQQSKAKYAKKPAKHHSGCYLCPSSSHQAWDERFHPRGADGKRQKVHDDVKAQIMQRIDNSSRTQSQKDEEKADVKRYWQQYNL